MKKKFILLSLVLSGTLLIGCTGKTADATEEIPLELEIVEQQAEIPTSTENLLEEQVEEKAAVEEGSLEFYQMLSEDLGIIEIYDNSDLTLEMLQNRDGKIIIEKCIGIVTSPDGDGMVLNYEDAEHYYINYSGVENIREGTVILSYFIYNPDTNYEDDILERFDYVIDRGNED